jgi:cobalt-zinc-cadmium efflux system protein
LKSDARLSQGGTDYAVILWSTWGLLREAFHLAMGGVPRDIDVVGVGAYMASLPGVEDVHDLHVWGLSTAEDAIRFSFSDR